MLVGLNVPTKVGKGIIGGGGAIAPLPPPPSRSGYANGCDAFWYKYNWLRSTVDPNLEGRTPVAPPPGSATEGVDNILLALDPKDSTI